MRIIAGIFRGRTLKTVEGPGYRPAMSRVRESLFSMLEARGVVWGDCRVMDLFAGSGSLAFEALSRGAQAATLVEMAPQAVKCLRANAAMLGLDEGSCRIVADDVLKMLGRGYPQACDVVFIDPPYGKNLLAPTIKALTKDGWIDENAIVAAEIEKHCALPAANDTLVLETDRNYGQTRVLLWQMNALETQLQQVKQRLEQLSSPQE